MFRNANDVSKNTLSGTNCMTILQKLAILLVATLTLSFAAGPAKADLLYWDFSFSGDGVVGSGELITSDTADPSAPLPGGLDIVSIDGMVNGEAITGLLGKAPAPTPPR